MNTPAFNGFFGFSPVCDCRSCDFDILFFMASLSNV
jgi:hypothetical protein